MSKLSAQRMMRAVVADPGSPGELRVSNVPIPIGHEGDSLVRVEAFSLNAGESRLALAATQRYVPGWDFSGTIERPGNSGFPCGTRVVGLLPAGAWAQYCTGSATNMVALPDNVAFAQGTALPVAGLTAMLCMRKGEALRNKRVLITGAAGGVGRYACQFAGNAGADLVAISRRENIRELLAVDGVEEVTIYSDIEAATAEQTYDFVLESVGGDSLGRSLASLNEHGKVVSCGNSSGAKTTFDVRAMYLRGETELHGFYLGYFTATGGCHRELGELIDLVSKGDIKVPLSREMPLDDIAEAVSLLQAQRIDGKVVIRPW